MVESAITAITLGLCKIIDAVGKFITATLITIVSFLGMAAIEIWLPATLTFSVLFLTDDLSLRKFIIITSISKLLFYMIEFLINKKKIK